MLPEVDLNLLVVLDAVLAERSVAGAARRLHVTSSAVSNALGRLREIFGDPLFSRAGRGIAPTPRALALAPALSRALADLGTIVHGETFDAARTTQTFTLAIADVGQVTYVPRLVASMATAMPRARLRVVGVDTLLRSGGLAGAEVDAAVVMSQRLRGVRSHLLYREELVFVTRAAHPHGARRWTSIDLAACRHVDVQISSGTTSAAVANALAQARVTRDVALVVPTFVAAAATVASTDYVAALPRRLVKAVEGTLALRPMKVDLPTMTVDIALSWHERTNADPAMTAFRALAVDAARARAGGSRSTQ